MILARGPCRQHVSTPLTTSIPVFSAQVEHPPPMLYPARVRILTHLLPLPQTVVGLVKSLPCRDIVCAVKTGEVDAACSVSVCDSHLSRSRARPRAERDVSREAEIDVPGTAGDSGTHFGEIGGFRGCCSDAMAGIQWVGEVQGVEPWRVRELRQAPHRGKCTDHDVQPSDAPPT